MIKTENLQKIFQTEEVETWALNDVSLKIEDGNILNAGAYGTHFISDTLDGDLDEVLFQGKYLFPTLDAAKQFGNIYLGKANYYSIVLTQDSAGHIMLDVISSATNKSAVENTNAFRSGFVAILGRPNVGKSSIMNRIVGEKRLIVSNIPGTTRDAVDTVVTNQFGTYTFIDTAGIRRKSKVEDKIEKYSVLRANMAVERADVCLIMIDGKDGICEQDEKIAGIAHEAGKACIIVVNKWDAVEKDNSTTNEYTNRIRTALAYMPYAPIIFVSALSGQRVMNLYQMINDVYEESCHRVSTGMLNDVLNEAMTRVQPPSDKGKRLKIYYMTEISVRPPTFVIFCNSEELFHFSYRRYIENCLRDTFGFVGTPIRLIIRQKGDKED